MMREPFSPVGSIQGLTLHPKQEHLKHLCISQEWFHGSHFNWAAYWILCIYKVHARLYRLLAVVWWGGGVSLRTIVFTPLFGPISSTGTVVIVTCWPTGAPDPFVHYCLTITKCWLSSGPVCKRKLMRCGETWELARIPRQLIIWAGPSPSARLITEAGILTPNVHIEPKLGNYIGAAHCDTWWGEKRCGDGEKRPSHT